MKKIICKRDYHKDGNSELDTFAGEVRNGIYTNPTVFPTPPFTEPDFDTVQEKFSNAAADYAQYGLTKKVALDEAKGTLMRTLDETATYVDGVADGNISTIALSGFVPTSDSMQPAAPLGIIDSFAVSLTKTSGQIVVDIPAYPGTNNVSYFCVCVAENPLANPFIVNGQLLISPEDKSVRMDYNRSRNKTFNGLTPGIKYYFYVYASNSAGVSPLSNPQALYAS